MTVQGFVLEVDTKVGYSHTSMQKRVDPRMVFGLSIMFFEGRVREDVAGPSLCRVNRRVSPIRQWPAR